MTASDLQSRFRHGDEAAFLDAVRAHGPVALAFARLHTETPEAAAALVVDAWREILRNPDEERPLSVQLVLAMHAAGDPPPGAARTVGEGRLAEVIGPLPHEQQEVVLLRDVAGWPTRDVAEALALSGDETRRLLGDARAALLRLGSGP